MEAEKEPSEVIGGSPASSDTPDDSTIAPHPPLLLPPAGREATFLTDLGHSNLW